MKQLIIILFSLYTASPLYAQQTDPAIARISYTFTHIRDTTQRDRPYKENMVLIAGKNASLYTSEDRINQMERMAEFIKQQAAANGGVLSNIVMQKGLIRSVSLTDFYFFAGERKLITIENMRERFKIEEDAPAIEWKISKDTATFSGIHCQKATAHFKGRNWIAWFAPDLPFTSGPWKLNGLPGLIVEANDARNEVQFKFAGLTKVSDTIKVKKNEMITIGTANISMERETYAGKEIKLPTNTVKATRAEVDRLKNALAENPAAALNSLSGGTTTMKRISGPSTATPTVKIGNNNPIELVDKKN
jgi:GLPGLI family protein